MKNYKIAATLMFVHGAFMELSESSAQSVYGETACGD